MGALFIGWLAPLVGEKWAKPVAIAAGVVLLLLAIFAAVKIHDHRVIKQHQAAQDAANAKADRAADQKSAVQRHADDNRVTAENQQIKEAINEARSEGRDPRAAYYDCVRLQQRARAAKLVVPTCH